MLADCWVDQRAAQLGRPPERAGVVQADQAAVGEHVGIDDGDQSPATRGLAGEGPSYRLSRSWVVY